MNTLDGGSPDPRPKTRSLRTQLALALSCALVAGLGFVIVGTYAFTTWGEMRFYNSLSEEAAEAYDQDWTVIGLPNEAILHEISIAEENILAPVYEATLTVTLTLAAIAIAAGLPFAVWAARRLTSPLEMATEAARRIADGDLAHRVQVPKGSAAEVLSLAQSFSHLAESLERMDEDVRFSSAAIAHEIRTPLTVVQGYLQGIRDGVFEADETRLDSMLQRLEALGSLLADLQTLSLADSGRLTLRPSSVRLAERLKRLVDWVAARTEGDPKWGFDDDSSSCAEIELDIERIEQVVLGLIENARRYAGENAEIHVRYSQDQTTAVITVEDDGPGFSDRALTRAPDRFWRDERSRSRETGGSGLGLPVARAVMEAHSGRLKLENRPEGGARVRLSLPVEHQSD